MKVEIKWKDVAYFRKCGHGVKVHFVADKRHYDLGQIPDDSSLVAFVPGFAWQDDEAEKAVVRLLGRDSPRFAKLGINGDELRDEAKQAIAKYVPDRKPFPDPKMGRKARMISKHLRVWVNG